KTRIDLNRVEKLRQKFRFVKPLHFPLGINVSLPVRVRPPCNAYSNLRVHAPFRHHFSKSFQLALSEYRRVRVQPLLRANHLAILSSDAASNHSPRLTQEFRGTSARAYPPQIVQVRI